MVFASLSDARKGSGSFLAHLAASLGLINGFPFLTLVAL